jgi:AraC family transcriptional regulator
MNPPAKTACLQLQANELGWPAYRINTTSLKISPEGGSVGNSSAVPINGENRLGSGSFFGGVRGRITHSGALFTDLRHSIPRRLPCHSHELPFFGLLLDGEYGERYGRETKQFGPFSIMFRPAGVPHQDEIGPRGARFFHVELRPGWKKRVEECSGSLETACEDSRGGRLVWLAMQLRRATFGIANPDELCVDSLLAEMVGLAARLPMEERRQPPSWLARLLDKLQAEHCNRLTLAELSREARVHPVHLSRVFRRFKGEGIGEYVHRLRARSACGYLLNPEMTLAEIGFTAGFSDQSHFTRAFRKITGMTPNAFRASIQPA